MRKPRPIPVSNDATLHPSRGERGAGSDTPQPAEPKSSVAIESRCQNALSVVMMAGIAFMPIVIAAGFLSEHLATPSVPREISTAAFRGPIDAEGHALSDDRPKDRGSEPRSFHARAGL